MKQWESTLFWRIFLPNALVLVAAGVVLLFSPVAVDRNPTGGQVVALALGLALMTAVNLMLIRRATAPLERLSAQVATIDPQEPGQRVDVRGGAETERLVAVFNAMLARLERERRESGRRMLAAQEGERKRLARELHDEVGQVVTALMLDIDGAARVSPPQVRERLAETREAARALADEIGEIVGRLRPETLDDLGLASAITVLGDEFTDRTGIPVQRELAMPPANLSAEAELALYRVAQEGLTNVARHSGAREARIGLEVDEHAVSIRIADDGRGIDGAPAGNGIRGMRERALLLGGSLRVEGGAAGGTEVLLSVPRGDAR
jgi:two-component system sensor histidine kinase UhpB